MYSRELPLSRWSGWTKDGREASATHSDVTAKAPARKAVAYNTLKLTRPPTSSMVKIPSRTKLAKSTAHASVRRL